VAEGGRVAGWVSSRRAAQPRRLAALRGLRACRRGPRPMRLTAESGRPAAPAAIMGTDSAVASTASDDCVASGAPPAAVAPPGGASPSAAASAARNFDSCAARAW
jgi:hypothetical protein